MLVLTSALRSASSMMTSRLINATRFQEENRLRAAFAREAALVLGGDPEVAYMAGLLQDFLLPLLTKTYEAGYVEAMKVRREFVEAEKELIGWDHASIAAKVMQDWGFPEELVCAVRWHHDAEHVVSHPTLRRSSVSAAFAAGSLPESLGQTSRGFEMLLRLQEEEPAFCFLDIAAKLDDESSTDAANPGQASNLADQLEQLAKAHLDDCRLHEIERVRQIGSYTLQEQLGHGAMGVVYRATHDMLHRQAAVKLLQASKINPSSLARFESEVQLTSQLSSPHTVAVYDYGVTPTGIFYYAMEYVEGLTLANLVERHGPLPAARVIHLLRQACASLAEAHSKGLIHRDVKPENLMICRRGGIDDTLKVLDFGLAHMISANPERDGVPAGLSGSPLYMSPESILSPGSVDVRSDLYSLAAVGFYLLTGQPVFNGKKLADILQQHAYTAPPRPADVRQQKVDQDLEEIVLRCLAKEPQARLQTASALANCLQVCNASGKWNQKHAAEWWAMTATAASG